MDNQESLLLFKLMYPGHFEREDVHGLPDNLIFEEMILRLNDFDLSKYNKKPDDNNISFGFYNGSIVELKKAVEKVDPDWINFFDADSRIYCGYVNGIIASFCLVDDMGVYKIGDRKIRVGGPGCVGTLPEYRNKGIGLTMVKHVTKILKDEGYDYSYIHFTGVSEWYKKLGYKTSVKWNKNGLL